MKLNKLYKKILLSIGCDIEKDGRITVCGEPVLVQGKELYLFYEGKNNDIVSKDDVVIFNILNENVLEGFSKPLNVLISITEMHLNLTLKSMTSIFLERMLTEYDYPISVAFRLKDLYAKMDEATVRSKKKFDELRLENFYKSIFSNTDRNIVLLNGRHRVVYEGEEFQSGIIATYPIIKELEEALDTGSNLDNSKMRKTDLKVFKAIMEEIENQLGKILGVSSIEPISDTTSFMKAVIHINRFIKNNYDIVADNSEFFCPFRNELSYSDIKAASKLVEEAELIPSSTIDAGPSREETLRKKNGGDKDDDALSADEVLRLLNGGNERQRPSRPKRSRNEEFIEFEDDDFFREPVRRPRRRRPEFIDDMDTDSVGDPFFDGLPW